MTTTDPNTIASQPTTGLCSCGRPALDPSLDWCGWEGAPVVGEPCTDPQCARRSGPHAAAWCARQLAARKLAAWLPAEVGEEGR